MKISVVVPVYNVEPYLKRCVDSILKQTFSDFELILVDDGSPDHCPSICDDYATKDDRVHVIHKENGGLSSARNAGIDYAMTQESEWLTFVDSDDWVHPQYLELLYRAVIEHDTRIGSCGYETVNRDCAEYPGAKGIIEVLTPEQYWCYTQTNATIAWGKLYSKELFYNLRYPEGVIHEDELTTYRALFACSTVVLVKIPLYFYFVNPDSIMRSSWSLKSLVAFRAYREQCEFFLEHGFWEAFRYSNRAYVWMIGYMFDESCRVPKQYRRQKRVIKKAWRNDFRRWREQYFPKSKKYGGLFLLFYPFKVMVIDNLSETLQNGGIKAVFANIKKHKQLKKQLKEQVKEQTKKPFEKR